MASPYSSDLVLPGPYAGYPPQQQPGSPYGKAELLNAPHQKHKVRPVNRIIINGASQECVNTISSHSLSCS